MALEYIPNFSKIINLKILTQVPGLNNLQRYAIKCPATGRKPNIEISGTLTPQDIANNIDVRIKNFYTDQLKGSITDIEIQAGYAGRVMSAFNGSVVQVYTDSPGPDRTTVISCTTAKYEQWLDSTLELHLAPGWALSVAIQQISAGLGFTKKPYIGVREQACPIPWDFSGFARDAFHKLNSFFPDIRIQVMNSQLYVYSSKIQRTKNIELKYLTCAPQISGDGVTLTAPWNPEIKPDDLVSFNSRFFTAAANGLRFDAARSTIRAKIIQFDFSTVGNTNQMIIQGTLDPGEIL